MSRYYPPTPQSSETKLTFIVNTKTSSELQTTASVSWSQPASLPDSLEPSPGQGRLGGWEVNYARQQESHSEDTGGGFWFSS